MNLRDMGLKDFILRASAICAVSAVVYFALRRFTALDSTAVIAISLFFGGMAGALAAYWHLQR